MEQLTDTQIIEAIQQGSAQMRTKALAYLYKMPLWRNTITKFVRDGGGNDVDAKDIMHDAFADLERNVREYKFNQESKLETYLIGIGKNKWRKKLERLKRLNKAKEELTKLSVVEEEEVTTSMELEEQFQTEKSWKEKLHEMITQLGEKCRRYLKFYMLNYSPAQILQLTDLKNEVQARKATYKCRNRLRKLIEEDKKIRELFKSRGHGF